MNKQQRVDVFKKAASIINERGLSKGAYLDADTGCACTHGALMLGYGIQAKIRSSIFPDKDYEYIWPEIDRFFNSQVEDDLMKASNLSYRGMIYVWNDDPETTKDDVIALFNKAIDLIEAEYED